MRLAVLHREGMGKPQMRTGRTSIEQVLRDPLEQSRREGRVLNKVSTSFSLTPYPLAYSVGYTSVASSFALRGGMTMVRFRMVNEFCRIALLANMPTPSAVDGSVTRRIPRRCIVPRPWPRDEDTTKGE